MSLTVSQISKTFGASNAVDNISFTIHTGEVVGFLGPNGAGKSTIFRMIMGEEKTMHTSKSLREYLHLLLCGLKKRFPDRFSSLETELVQEIVRDEQSGQRIHTWYVKLFVLNSESQRFEVQMEKGTLWIDDGGNKWFISTGADGNSLIFSETPCLTSL